MSEVKKAIIPAAGLGTRFLPLSRIIPKEWWPLVDIPVIQHLVNEAKNSGIEEILFVTKPKSKFFSGYFTSDLNLEKALKERKKSALLGEMKEFEEAFKNISFSYAVQKKPQGDAHALLQGAKWGMQEPVACLWADDIVDSKVPCIEQLKKVFKTSQKPVIALHRLPKDKLSSYGVVEVEKVANRLYKIKKIVEKPPPGKELSDLAVVGKYILTPEVFRYMKKAEPGERGEILLSEVFDKMLKEGHIIYGYEFEGKWLECGTKADWLKSALYLALKHPIYGPELKQVLRELI